MNYKKTKLKHIIDIPYVVTVHYFEYTQNYIFSGEAHDFWEFVYVDKGEVTAITHDKEILLRAGDIIFHKPGEWHNIKNNEKKASNVVIIAFYMSSKSENFFYNKVTKISNSQKLLLSKIMDESVAAFSSPLNNPYTEKLIENPGTDSQQQLISLYLTEFMVLFLHEKSDKRPPRIHYIADNTTFAAANDYMNRNISKKLYVSDIAGYLNISEASLKKLFRENAGCGVIEYFNNMKIDKAKEYLREKNYNISGISEKLGFNTAFYFSYCFKKNTGMSPSEYAESVKSILEIKGEMLH